MSLKQLQEKGRKEFEEQGIGKMSVINMQFIDSYAQTVWNAAIEVAKETAGRHVEGDNLGYCDTGSDMEMWCRSDCMGMAQKRLSALKQPH